MPDWHLARGFQFAGIHCGIRSDPNRKDLALITTHAIASAAGVFTQNRVCAAPVQVCRQRVPSGNIRGIVICSGNANACTGDEGLRNAERMAAMAADGMGCKPEQVLVCSTGIIGRQLPMERIEPGIRRTIQAVRGDVDGMSDFAHAILTTDTQIKVVTRTATIDNRQITFTGIAKGAAMIGPNVATMLAFILTDAAVAPADLQRILADAADRSFNCISVEGHTSTNDTVLVLANGAAGGSPLQGSPLAQFAHEIKAVCADLAMAIANDAEGITHLITIDVTGTRTDADARRIAKTIAESALVKTAIFGADPNWGRIVSAAGYAGVPFAEKDLSLWLGDFLLYKNGVPQAFDAGAASAYLKDNRDVGMRLVFALGDGRCRFWTCDLGYEYVRLNAEYTT